MARRSLLLRGAFTLAVLSLLLAPWNAQSTAAQPGPVAQPLDQLSGDPFDQAFLLQMSIHHAISVVMARPVVANAAHQELREFGNQIIADQTAEIAQMRTWARAWYGVEIPDVVAMMEAMAMGQAGGGPVGPPTQGMPMPMSGMSMLADLWRLPPNRLEAVFLSLMIPHHQEAIDIASLAPQRAAHQELKDLSQSIIAGQSNEIDQMNAWLAAWYGL